MSIASEIQKLQAELPEGVRLVAVSKFHPAEAVAEAAKDGPYLSKDDFRQRTKASKTVIDYMAKMGLFGDLPESNQLSLFDL